MAREYTYWLHSPTSRVWATESDGKRVTGVCGPIAVEDAEPALLDYLSYTEHEVTWFNGHLAEFSPIFHSASHAA